MQLRKTPQAHPVMEWSTVPDQLYLSAAGVLHNELLYRVELAVTCAAVGKLNFDRRVSPLENGPAYKRWTSDVDENQDTKN